MLRISLCVAALVVCAAADVSAQVSRGRYQAPSGAAATGRRAVQAPRVVTTPVFTPFMIRGFQTHTPVPVAVRFLPAVLMSDGSILADFGFGLEPVSRPCSAPFVTRSVRVVAGNGWVLTPRTPFVHPAPAPMTPSQQNLPSVQRELSRAALASCFARDAAGNVVVTH